MLFVHRESVRKWERRILACAFVVAGDYREAAAFSMRGGP